MQYGTIPAYLIDLAWFVLLTIWVVTAFTAKRTATHTRGRWWAYRLIVAAIIYLIVRLSGSKGFFLYYIHNLPLQWIGVVLVYIGTGTAIWARYYLGRNWGMPMSVKEGAELVTTGPYAYIRNPIYTGIFFAMIGSALALGVIWAIIFALYLIYLIPSVFVEEKIMARLFPDAYPAYKARTKRLIPWIW